MELRISVHSPLAPFPSSCELPRGCSIQLRSMPFVLASTVGRCLRNVAVEGRGHAHPTERKGDSKFGEPATRSLQYAKVLFVSPSKSAGVELYSTHEAVR